MANEQQPASSGTNTAIVAILVIVILAFFMFLFFFRGGTTRKEYEVDINLPQPKKPSSIVPFAVPQLPGLPNLC